MKNKMKLFSKLSLSSGLAAVIAIAAWLPDRAVGAEQMKGAEHLLHLQGIKTKTEADALKPGDSMAMVCTKCKSVVVHSVTTEKGHIKTMTVGEKHLCPGCNSVIEVVGHGKAKHDEVKHVCKACGEDSVFCCATKPGSGPTKGMEKEKK